MRKKLREKVFRGLENRKLPPERANPVSKESALKFGVLSKSDPHPVSKSTLSDYIQRI